MRKDRGSLSALVVCLVLAAIALAGLVFDGGSAINSYVQLSDLAENAARVGAQEITGSREGNAHIDAAPAIAKTMSYLHSYGVRGEVQVSGVTITVQVFGRVKYQILNALGLDGQRIQLSRTVQVVSG